MKNFKINRNLLGDRHPAYFIADIAANHDGDLSRAKKLIKLCAKAGANAAKFQHFKAETIVSDKGFKEVGKITHQSKWKKSVYQVYKDASINFKWTKILKAECKKNKIDFMTSPYDLDYVDMVNKYICAYKIGSGDITWIEIIKKIAKKGKPVILSTGAATLSEVKKALNTIKKFNSKIILMQCNTNYTNEEKNFHYINLKVLKSYEKIFGKNVILGLSDHTEGHTTVLGAVSLGARVIEKHFTDDNNRIGPDHKFSMNPITWREMVKQTRKLERAMGDGNKKIELNEKQSSIVQKRSCYANTFIKKGSIIKRKMIIPLRPCIKNSYSPDKILLLINKKAKKNIKAGECIKKNLVH